MLLIDEEIIKRVTSGDTIVRGVADDIKKGRYEEGWIVIANYRESEHLEVEKSGRISSISSPMHLKQKLYYSELVGNDWYILY